MAHLFSQVRIKSEKTSQRRRQCLRMQLKNKGKCRKNTPVNEKEKGTRRITAENY